MTSLPTVRFLDRTTPPHIATLILLAGVSALNMSIFLPSLAKMADAFDTDYATMQFAVSGYLAATAVMQIFVGPLSDKFGRRKVSIVGLALFVLASLGAWSAQSIETFLAFRIMQSVVATGMVLSRAIVRDMVPQDQAASMIGWVTMGMALVPMVGPIIGGMLDTLLGWRAVFGFLSLAGIGVLMLVISDQGETVQGEGVGFGTQLRTYPELLTSPRFWGYTASAAFGSGAFFAFLGGAPYVADRVFGLSPLLTGAALGAPAIGYAFGNGLSGRYSTRFGINKMALWGNLIMLTGLIGSLGLGLMGYSNALIFFGFCVFVGLGNGLMLPNVMAGALSVRPHLAGTASGLSGALMIGGGAALSQLAGYLLTDSALPLQTLMAVSAALAVLSILYVLRREAQLA